MQRSLTTILLLYYMLGTVIFPMGDLSYVKDLPQMYSHCAQEDPDMNLGDFVVEHLMNMQDEDDAPDPNERPHQAVFSHSPVQVLVTCAPMLMVVKESSATLPVAKLQAADRHKEFIDSYISGILRPPIYC